MNRKTRVLIVCQAFPQWYIGVLKEALGEDAEIEIMAGNKLDVSGYKGVSIIQAMKYNPSSIKSRLRSWRDYSAFVKKWYKKNKTAHYDMIYAISNPPINAHLGLYLKKRFHAPLVYMIWDIYPQVIEAGIKNIAGKTVSKLWHSWNSRNYRKIDKVLTLGEVMAESINSSLKNKIDISVIPIPVDTSVFKPIKKEDNRFIEDNGLENKFIILYSGKMGRGHNIELILETSKKLTDYKDILFLFIGQGEKYKTVESFIKENNSPNVRLMPLQPIDVFPYSIACGDIGIVSEEAEMAHLFMPSKTFNMMACREAIIGIGSEHDDLKKLISDNNIGYSVTDNSPETLEKDILKLYNDRDLLEDMKEKSRKTMEEKYSAEKVVEMHRKIFSEYV